jgi:ankyrin repeat protein
MCEWKGGDELVSMMLAARVDVNAVTPSQCNAAFFAGKYGSPTTLDLLIKAGINIHQVDKMGRTCLWNAIERPSPTMFRCLLDHLPATETFPTFVGSQEGRER